MFLSAGAKLGPYDVLAPLSAGGMGEVYRARDTSLNREVALKVLPEAFSQDTERLARFRREAHVLASLNHPHIGSIYGLEESGAVPCLVLELVDGETLANRLKRGGDADAFGLAVALVAAVERAGGNPEALLGRLEAVQ